MVVDPPESPRQTELDRVLAGHFADVPRLRPMLTLGDDQVIHGFSAGAEQALRWWQSLSPLASAIGHRPLIVDPQTPSVIADNRQVAQSFQVDLAACANHDGATLLAAKLQRELDMRDRWERRRLHKELAGRERWPAEPRRHSLAEVPSYRWNQTMVVLLMPVSASWQIPCLTGYGNWNAYPQPPEHSAILRHWHERYGAELLAMTFDTMDIAIGRPPSTRSEALRAAWELGMYNNDGVYDLHGDTVTEAAASLLGADVWLARWD